MKSIECKGCPRFYIDEDNIYSCMELGVAIKLLGKCPNNCANEIPKYDKPKNKKHFNKNRNEKYKVKKVC